MGVRLVNQIWRFHFFSPRNEQNAVLFIKINVAVVLYCFNSHFELGTEVISSPRCFSHGHIGSIFRKCTSNSCISTGSNFNEKACLSLDFIFFRAYGLSALLFLLLLGLTIVLIFLTFLFAILKLI